jgi:hypothetical protein
VRYLFSIFRGIIVKAIKKALAVAVITSLMSAAQAATTTYAVSGILVATNLTDLVSYDPALPTFSGFLTIDELGSFTENSLIFDPYTIHLGQGYVYRPNYTASFGGGVADWSGNTLTINGLTSTESSTGDVYVDLAPLPPADDSVTKVVLTFADTAHFSGTSYEIRHSQGFTFWTASSLSGIAIPIPAAAWLFGSGLVGLAEVVRRRKQI